MQQSFFRFGSWLIWYHIIISKKNPTLVIDFHEFTCLQVHLFGTLEYFCRYGNPFWLLKRNKKKLDPIFKFLCRPCLHFHHGEHLLHYHTILNDAVLLYSKFCLLCLLVIIVSRRKKQTTVYIVTTYQMKV